MRVLILFSTLFFSQGVAGQAIPFRWEPAGIPVFDAEEIPFQRPFVGGFNVPRPQFVDIDGDEDLDLFVQEKSNEIIFFENTGLTQDFAFEWRSSHFFELDVGEWYRFVDLDSDGDHDLLAEQPFSFIRYYRNDGSAQNPNFVLAADTLFDTDGEPVFADRQNIPNVVDVDCDDTPDLFLGRLDGTIAHYRIASFDNNSIPTFELISDQFQGLLIVAESGKQNADGRRTDGLHGANTLTFVDIEPDGDPDLFWGDFFEPGLLFFENTGTCASIELAEAVPFPTNTPLQTSGYNAPAFGDINQDGRVDLLVGVLGGAFSSSSNTADNLLYFSSRSGTELDFQTSRFLSNLDFGTDSLPVLHDLDDDGDFDLVVTNSIDPNDIMTGASFIYENRGTVNVPAFYDAGTLPLSVAYNYAPTFGDLSGDGLADMIVGSWQGELAYYQKSGEALDDFELVDAVFLDLPSGSNGTPVLVDIDADSDLDLVVGEANGTLNFFENTGSPAVPSFASAIENWGGIDAGRRSVPLFLDFDEDNDQDLVLGSDQDGLQFYRNIGNAQSPAFEIVPLFDLPQGRRMTPTLADLDADGDVDLIHGGLEGGLRYYENITESSVFTDPLLDVYQFRMANYPNPFSKSTRLKISSERNVMVKIRLLNVTGQEVQMLYAGMIPRGVWGLSLELSRLPAGVYIVNLQGEMGINEIHRLVKLR